jgi:hypothetical protein
MLIWDSVEIMHIRNYIHYAQMGLCVNYMHKKLCSLCSYGTVHQFPCTTITSSLDVTSISSHILNGIQYLPDQNIDVGTYLTAFDMCWPVYILIRQS